MKRGICNELFGGIDGMDFSASLNIIRETGFHGVEIAPHTLFGDFSGNIRQTLTEIRQKLDGEGVGFAGFHWLLVGPEELHVCSADAAVRRKSWDHIKRLADLGGELGGGPMTFGSPAQRSSKGISTEEAVVIFTDGLSSVAGHIEGTGCRLLVEALPSEFTDVVNTLEETRAVIDSVGKPGIGGMFDFHNTDDEIAPWDVLIREHGDYIAHVHLNDAGGIAPTAMTEEYRKAFTVLGDIGHDKWLSLEIFTEPADPAAILKQVAGFLEELEELE
ncbi:MAG: sugar phosphate isomerase/epimerase [Spirochaetaceae bacterium]|nr:sugar phosphate isomerase/epimerase [Spirochaetaceae bacterium]